MPAAWWQPDGWRPGSRSLVAEIAGTVVAAAARRPNRVHPLRHSASLHVSGPSDHREQSTEGPSAAGVAVLRALRAGSELPLSLKAPPGSVEHATILAAGGVPYQRCPAALVPTGTPELRDWCEAQLAKAARSGIQLVRGDEQTTTELTRTWTRLYEVVHADWSPTAPTATLLEVFGPMIKAELDSDRSVLALVDGEIVAAGCVFLDSEPGGDRVETSPPVALEAVVEALVPGRPHARGAVGACLADVLSRTDGRPVEFDGHRSDPHFFPLLQSIPGVQVGEVLLDLLEL